MEARLESIWTNKLMETCMSGLSMLTKVQQSIQNALCFYCFNVLLAILQSLGHDKKISYEKAT